MIPKNSLLKQLDTQRLLRFIDEVPAEVVGNDEAVSFAVLIDVDPAKKSLPELMPYEKFVAQLERARIKGREGLLLIADERPSLDHGKLTEGEKRVLKKRWEIAEELLKHGAKLYVPAMRAAIARDLEAREVASRQTQYLVMTLFWKGGMTQDALLPEYRNSGAPGHERIATDESKKVGRPRSIEPGRGVAMTEWHRSNMCKALAREKAVSERILPDIYHRMLGRYYAEHVSYVPTNNGNKLVVTNHDRVPRLEQFQRYWRKRTHWEARARKTFGSRLDSILRLITTGTLTVRGPGARYYIDATVLDAYVVSRLDRNRVIGRPTLYVVADQFSRMIVGFHLGLEPPSWVGALLAVWNCNVDKVALCAHFGIDVAEKVWPTGHMPLHLMGDRGELTSRQAELLAAGFNFSVENAPPYRGDAKGIVERDFRTLQARFGEWLPGWVDKDVAYADAEPAALSAAMTLEEMSRLIIARIIERNTTEMDEYEGIRELTHDKVALMPVELWHWGHRNLRTEYRSYSKDHLIRHLWPETSLKLGKRGLKFCRGLYLMGESLPALDWFRRAQFAGGSELRAFYNPTALDRMYLDAPDGRSGMFEIGATRRSQQFAMASHSEFNGKDIHHRQLGCEKKWEYMALHVQVANVVEEVTVSAAQRKAATADSSLSKAQKLGSIRENRQAELDRLDREVAAARSPTTTNGVPLSTPGDSQVESEADKRTRDYLASKMQSRG